MTCSKVSAPVVKVTVKSEQICNMRIYVRYKQENNFQLSQPRRHATNQPVPSSPATLRTAFRSYPQARQTLPV